MPAQSQQQQKLFGLALSVKRGDTPRSEASEEVLKIVDSMTEKEIEDFAGTEHEGLPKKVEQKIREMARQTIKERMIGEAKFSKGDMVRVVDNPKYVMDKKKFAGMSGYVKNIIGRDIQVTFPNGRTIMVAPKDLEMNPNESVNEAMVKIEVDMFKQFNQRRPDKTMPMKIDSKTPLSKLLNHTTFKAIKQKYDYIELHYGDKFLGSAQAGTDNWEFKKGRGLQDTSFKESVNEDATQLWSQTIDMLDKNLKKGYDPTKIRNVNLIAGTLQKLFKGLPQRYAMDMATTYNDYRAGQKDKNQTVKDWVRILKKHQIKESVNEAVKKGKRYGDWTVTQYEPVKYDDYGAPNGGRIKIVNQKTGNDLLIQNDLALRGSKWYISVNRRTIKDTNPEKVIQKAINNSVNEASGEFVVYVEKDNGRKKLLHTKKSQRAANMFMSKNADKILNSSGIRSIGTMSKDQWEKEEAQFAENIKKSDMKTVTKKEWDRTHKDYKGMIKGQPYMMWFDKQTQSTVYGPVQIKG